MSTSSLNLYKSFTYAQPEAYHFSHDSVFLSRQVFESVRAENIPCRNVIDLCAGCGIVGLDFAFHLANEADTAIRQLDFVEVQEVYRPHLEENIKTFKSQVKQHFNYELIFENYANLHLRPKLESQYDLLLCNPPYFRISQGKLSPSDFKNRCRFFIDSDYPELLQAINFLLKPGGSAFILLQSLKDHNIDVESELKTLSPLKIINRGKIRATGFYQLLKSL